MAFGSKRSGGSDKTAISPVLLAAVLALVWIALSPAARTPAGAPEWAPMVILGTRFLAGFVAGWVVISLLQLVLRLAWLAASQLYLWTRKERT
ncbi:MAG: OpgC domain-containing protein [Stellaceae bacterium]